MENPKVSIIVPVYNVEKYLAECLDSILSQTFTDFECILVNDNSPDKSPDICDEYAKKDKRIKVIHKKKNEGLPQARKTGFNASVGDYILYADSDDWMEQNMVERLYKLATTENYDIVYCCADDFYDLPEYGEPSVRFYFDIRNMNKDDIIINLIKYKFDCVVWNKLFKRELFRNVSFPKLWQFEDAFICVQLFLNATNVGYEYSVLYHHRNHPDSLVGKVFLEDKNKQNKELLNSHNEELLHNWKCIQKILSQHEDYYKYKEAIEWRLNHINNFYYKPSPKFSLKNLPKYFLPYGGILLYRSLKRNRSK